MRLTDLQAAYRGPLGDKLRGMPSTIPVDSLRPQLLAEFIGQRSVIAQLGMLVKAARKREAVLDHVLMTGPGGLGKTTLALMMANEMGAPIISTTAPTLGQEPLTRMLTGMKAGTIFFVDEIHGMSRRTAELLYGALEDGFIDCNTPMGFERRKVQPFTLVGATTDPGKLTNSFKDRFGQTVRLEFYPVEDLTLIAHRTAAHLKITLDDNAAEEVAIRGRGVPRVINQLMRRLRDFAVCHDVNHISRHLCTDAFRLLEIDEMGLEKLDRDILQALTYRFNGGPIGLDNLAVAVGDDPANVAKDSEPYLVRLGLMARTPRGRVITENGRQHVEDMS